MKLYLYRELQESEKVYNYLMKMHTDLINDLEDLKFENEKLKSKFSIE